MLPLVEQRLWQVLESPFNTCKLSHLETILTVGNGYMGLRGTFEEGYPGEIVSTMVHGLYNHAAGELVPDLINLPNPLPIALYADGELFSMKPDHGKILGYRRWLDLKTATLTREVMWKNSLGAVLRLRFERFASLTQDHLLAQRLSIMVLLGNPVIRVESAIDPAQSNDGIQHLGEQHDHTEGDLLWVAGTTTQSHYRVAVACTHLTTGQVSWQRTNPAHTARVTYESTTVTGAELSLTKLTAIHSNRDSADPLAAAKVTLQHASSRGFNALHAEHVQEWAAYWNDSDIQIDGDEVAQRGYRFCAYHLLIAAPRHDEHVSIGAKTLSGAGYKGHVFWDTELFMVPMFTLTQPKLARNLLMYRYHNLAGARHKAQTAGYEGAMFPWESTDTGEETTPQWTHPLPDGSRIRIWTGDNEQHISTDIAYSIMQYWRWTGDDYFYTTYGVEIVLDTAVFWGSRVEHVAATDRYELSMQIGPDEYHDNVNNSAFTNRMAQWHLQTALQVRQWLLGHHPEIAATLLARLKIDDKRIAHWHDIIAKMYIPQDPKTGVIEQFDGFFNLDRVDLQQWQPRWTNFDAIVGHEPTQHYMVIKQADIVMLMALLDDDFGSLDLRHRNWDFYFPVVDHGSSLSQSTHAWVAARLNLIEDAYKLFNYAASMDLDDLKGNIRDGIHAAGAGGVWQALVFGFAGLSLDAAGQIKTDPHLPPHWRSLRFKVWHQGQQREITVTSTG